MQSDPKLNLNFNISFISQLDILLFTKHLVVMLKSGLTLHEGLELLAKQHTGKMKKVLNRIISVIESGEQFYRALELYPKYFSPVYIQMVRSGEIAGTLEENLEYLSVQLSKAYELKKKVQAAMIYPTLIFVAILGLGLSVGIFILPKIVPLFKALETELPPMTKFLLRAGEIFDKHGTMILITSILGFITLVWLLRQNFMKPLLHRFYLKIPTIKKVVRDINLEIITRVLGLLLTSGIPLIDGIKITGATVENRLYRKKLLSTVPQIEAGNSFSDIIGNHSDLFPLSMVQMIAVGERTGNLDNNLKYLSEFYEEEVNNATKNLSAIIEPVMLIFIGLVVGTVAIAILGPIYEISGNLG